MRWKLLAFWILATACATRDVSAAEGLPNALLFRQWIAQRTKFTFTGGRVANSGNAWMFGVSAQTNTDGPAREQINLNGNGVTGSLVYTYRRGNAKGDAQNDPVVDFGIDMNSEGRFVLRYSDKDHPLNYFNFTQVPGQPVSLSLPPADKPRVLQAPTVWHLLIIHSGDCRQQFLPELESLRSDWHVARTVQAAEDELVKMAAVSRKADRKQWEAWVNQLGDPIYMKRDHADRNLREVGPAVLGYLNRLNMNQLDAEQKSRLRGIIRELTTASGEDTPERVASMLVSDPLVWLALLARPEESTRQAAVQQLSVLLNVPINVDPKAQPDSQAKARDELRAQIEKIVGASQ
jgi:hypothetical protein